MSQLGPAKAAQILSGVSPQELARAIAERDAAALKRVKGIGDKLANRIIVDLQGRLPEEAEGKEGGAPSKTKDAAQALMALGYDRPAAEAAVRKAHREAGDRAPVEELVRRSLAHV